MGKLHLNLQALMRGKRGVEREENLFVRCRSGGETATFSMKLELSLPDLCDGVR